MTNLNTRGLRLSYGVIVLILLLEVIHAAFKFYNPYYFHVYSTAALALATMSLGWYLRINRFFVLIFGILTFSLMLLKYWIVWN